MPAQKEQLSLQAPNPSAVPEWLPDETFFSWASRYHHLSGAGQAKNTCLALFGHGRWGYQHDFPCPLNSFVAATRGGFGDAELIARQRTVLPFYLAHRDESTARAAYATMAEPAGGMLKYQLGMLTSRFRANHPLKACLQCMRDDSSLYGSPYWHLTHQLPGVWVCPSHGNSLLTCDAKSTGIGRFSWVLPNSDHMRPSTDTLLKSGAHEALTKFAALSIAWSAMEPASFRPDLLAATYRSQLTTIHGPTERTVTAQAYGKAVQPLQGVPELQHLVSSPSQARDVLNRLIFSPRGHTHPLRHLSLIYWLFEDWQSFMSSYQAATTRSNKTGSRRQAGRAAQHLIDSRKDEALARLRSFEAPSRIAKALKLATQTVIAWGAESGIRTARSPKLLKGDSYGELVDALHTGIDKADAALKFGVSVQTVTRVLRSEVGLSDAWHQARLCATRNAARGRWHEQIAQQGHLGIKHLRQLEPSIYAWLYRNDRTWLCAECGQASKVRTNNSAIKWDERDRTLSTQVRHAALTHFEHGVGRLRLVDLLAAIPELKAKLSALDRLPLTLKAINEVIPPRKGTKREKRLV